MPYRWNRKYHGIALVFEPSVVRVNNDEALKAFLTNWGQAYRLASFIKEAYFFKYKTELKITTESLATEIYDHFKIQEVFLVIMGCIRWIPWNGPLKRFSDWMLDHMDVIDCGEKFCDNNRFLWDYLSRHH